MLALFCLAHNHLTRSRRRDTILQYNSIGQSQLFSKYFASPPGQAEQTSLVNQRVWYRSGSLRARPAPHLQVEDRAAGDDSARPVQRLRTRRPTPAQSTSGGLRGHEPPMLPAIVWSLIPSFLRDVRTVHLVAR